MIALAIGALAALAGAVVVVLVAWLDLTGRLPQAPRSATLTLNGGTDPSDVVTIEELLATIERLDRLYPPPPRLILSPSTAAEVRRRFGPGTLAGCYVSKYVPENIAYEVLPRKGVA